MKQFSELGIICKKSYVGNKVYIENILDKKIIIEFFQIGASRKNDGTDCLKMQVTIDEQPNVIFTGSTFLMNVIKQMQPEDFPVETTIIKKNRHYEFS